MAVSRLSIIKFLELALTVACLVLHHYSYDLSDISTQMLCSGTFIGFLVIITGQVVGHVMQTPSHKRIDIFYCLVGVAMFVASGAVIIDRFQHYGKSELRDKNLAKASLAIINGAVLLIDATLTQRGG